MDKVKRDIFRTVSFLLEYPGDELLNGLSSAEDMVEDLPSSESKEGMRLLIRHLRDTPLIQLQEEYTRIFDMSPGTCLNLTYHKWGDGKERGSAMAQLNDMYLRAGCESFGTELPDYLPRVLEFLSICPGATGSIILKEYGGPVELLASRLGETKTGYAVLGEILKDVFTS